MDLDHKILTNNFLQFQDVKIGMKIAVEKLSSKASGPEVQEVWLGKVVQLTRNPQLIVHVDVEAYFRERSHRTRFKRKIKPFKNSLKLTLHLVEGRKNSSTSQREARRAKRKLYAQQRQVLSQRRDQSTEDIQLLMSVVGQELGISIHIRMDDSSFKKLSRKVALKFHPDKFEKASEQQKQFAQNVFKALNSFKMLRERALS